MSQGFDVQWYDCCLPVGDVLDNVGTSVKVVAGARSEDQRDSARGGRVPAKSEGLASGGREVGWDIERVVGSEGKESLSQEGKSLSSETHFGYVEDG